jgi:membrane protein DedA with SNARE-associated domain
MEDWAIRLIDWGGYWAVFLLSLIETLVLPMPSEVILPIAGMRAANGPLELPGVIAASTAGSMTGNLIWFRAASSLDPARLQTFIERNGRWMGVSWPEVEGVRRLFARLGPSLVLTGRLVPLVRTLVSIPAGLARMRLLPYLLWSTIGTAAFAAALTGAGYYAGERFSRIEEIAGPVSSSVLIGIALWWVWSQLTWKMRMARRARRQAETPDR